MPELKFAKYSPRYVHDSMIVYSMTTQMQVWMCIYSYILLTHKDIPICNVCKGQVTLERWKYYFRLPNYISVWILQTFCFICFYVHSWVFA